MSLVGLGQQLLEAVRGGQDDDVKALMANGAPFTTDWMFLTLPVREHHWCWPKPRDVSHSARASLAQPQKCDTLSTLASCSCPHCPTCRSQDVPLASTSACKRTECQPLSLTLELGSSPLHLAAKYGHQSTAEVLLRAGVSRDARTKVDKTPLHIAASEGHYNIHGAEVDARDMLKMTALHWAAQRGHREVAELLLRYGADVHCLSKFDKTPFDIAMDTSNTELMILLQVDRQRGWGRGREADTQTELSRGKDNEM
ncbi:hypothetical protein JOQ06_014215 [Pogonophryne albipinna]|uniref:Uncharacterized protein n=1 Tax=Pogonophryne albipinna TaxID=1090488 RepID=A0AAD6F6H0_9TELE|nr:hypothetical protein JOQ06_014215 [Pogonophryne albipinna]